ncbi:MAG TPA: response regulator, partial [Anaerovoracaceae bacterium]|nr:response regulator [Anaerovoracaceae bacterium]
LLEQKASEIQIASKYKTEFLANMSHELRTPLNSSLILSKLLMENAKGNLTEEQIQFASSIYSSGSDLLNLINDILDLSKVEAGKLDIRAEKVSVSEVLDGMKGIFQSWAQERKLGFDVICEKDIPQSLLTDRQRLDQILKNLLSNAFKFTTIGSVEIRLYRVSKDTIAFEVKDTGIGIPEEQLEIIFEPFRQADGTTNRKYGGTGLGLSISRDLARLLGGHLEVESTEGKGSLFTLMLPESFSGTLIDTPSLIANNIKIGSINQRNLENFPHIPFEDDRNDLDGVTRVVLVIEDDTKFATVLYDLAHELKYKCIVAQGADEGFAMAIEYNPFAVLLDILLPDHPGLTVLDRLKGNPKTRHIPVHVLSVEDFSTTVLNMGASGFMLKPVKRKKIIKVFEEIEVKFSQKIRRVLVAENDEVQRQIINDLLVEEGVEITTVSLAKDAIHELKTTVFDCMIMALNLPDMSGADLLQRISLEHISSLPPVIVYCRSILSQEEEDNLRKYSRSIIIKGARSPERLLDEVTLFLHLVESKMTPKHREILATVRSREQIFEGMKILLVDDDIRNIFALTSALEQRGTTIIVARNGHEALARLDEDPTINLVLMDVMMPEMDGYEATQKIRSQKRFAKLPIIAVTARAMKDDQEKCLKAGANDYLSKPVDLDKLLSLIRVWISKTGMF